MVSCAFPFVNRLNCQPRQLLQSWKRLSFAVVLTINTITISFKWSIANIFALLKSVVINYKRNSLYKNKNIVFFVISTSDRGDFPRIIEIALLLIISFCYIIICALSYVLCNKLSNYLYIRKRNSKMSSKNTSYIK